MQSGILALAHKGDWWIADKGFIIQHIFDSYGVRIDTPQKLAGKKQFNEQEDVHNRGNSQVRVHVERAIGILNLEANHTYMVSASTF